MRRRLAGLFVIAIVAGLAAGTVASAKDEAQGGPDRFGQSSPAVVVDLCPVPARYRPAFESAARDTHLPLALLISVARVESNLDHSARSLAGAQGLLQVMPPTAAELRLDATDLALAAYNAGPGAVEQAHGAPGEETIAYVANVNRLWQHFNGCS